MTEQLSELTALINELKTDKQNNDLLAQQKVWSVSDICKFLRIGKATLYTLWETSRLNVIAPKVQGGTAPRYSQNEVMEFVRAYAKKR